MEQAVDSHLDACQLAPFLGRDEGVGHPLAAHAAGAADAMDVIVAELRNVVIDDVRDAGDVDAAADDVGGDQHLDLSLAKGGHHAIADVLRQIAVDAGHVLEPLGQAEMDFVGARVSCGRRRSPATAPLA